MNLSLRHKIQALLISVLAGLALLALGLFAVLQQRTVSKAVSSDQTRVQKFVERYTRKRSADMITRAQFVADLPTLKSAMLLGQVGRATIHQRFLSYQEKLNASSFFITDETGQLITYQGSLWSDLKNPSRSPGVATAINGIAWSGIVIHDGIPLFGVSVPVKFGGYVKGSINIFDPIDSEMVKEFSADLATDVAITRNGKILTASVPGLVIDSDNQTEIEARADGVRYVGTTVSLSGEDASIVTLRNYDDLVAPFRQAEGSLGAVLIVVLVLGIFTSRVIADRMVSQIDSLLGLAKELTEGEWPNPIPVTRTDEIGTLQTAFNEMSSSLKEGHRLLLSRTDELRHALKRAESSTQARTKFLTTISHELRTPLNGSIGMVQMLEATSLSPEQASFAKTIAQNNERLLSVVNDVLNYVELESGQAASSSAEVDIAAFVQDTIERHRPDALAKGIDLLSVVPGRLDYPTIHTDSVWLRQLLDQLVDNAIKFTSNGSVLIAVSGSNGQLDLTVQDTGCGIPPEKVKEIFEPFQQAEGGAARRFEGTGLGLAICRQIATMIGAELSVRSDVGKGSSFTLTLPVAMASGAKSVQSSPDIPRVLIVDDNAVNLKVAAKICEKAGCETVCALSAGEALEGATEKFDLILMDCHMPEMDGFECTRLLRDARKDIPTVIYALSASEVEEDRVKATEAGMDGYLVKPLRLEQVKQILFKDQSQAA
jgi:signal transduction histidine kinase/CheY-like chemotaxis protein